jgi:hypothetical protein
MSIVVKNKVSDGNMHINFQECFQFKLSFFSLLFFTVYTSVYNSTFFYHFNQTSERERPRKQSYVKYEHFQKMLGIAVQRGIRKYFSVK